MNEQEDFRPAEAALKNDAAEIRRLRAAGVEVNPIYEAGPSPMETALQLGHFEAFWALLEEAAPEVLEDALCLTAYWGQVSAFERLLAQGVPVDAQDSVGENALASAAKGEGDPQSRLVIARRLMAAGIDPADALTYAARSHERPMLDLLRSKGQKLDLAGTVSLGDLDEIRRALTKETPTAENLQAAAAQGNVETLRLLIARTSLRPPHIVNFAISQGHLSAVEFMLANGWNVRESMYVLLAAQHGHAAMLKLLLSLGADPNAGETEDSEPSPFANEEYRRSPVWTAVNGDHLEALDVLLRAGADPNVVTFCGSPLRTAIDRGRSAAVVARLREAGAQDIPPPARR